MSKNLYKLITIFITTILFISSCAYNPSVSDTNKTVNIPDIKNTYNVPIGDADSKYVYTANIYLPDKYTYKLNKKVADIELSLSDKCYEELVEYLLGYKEDDIYASPTYNINIGLYGETPVCVYKNHAIVNLTANALLMDREQFYLLSSCIAKTLMDFANIQSVNVIVADRAVSMDILGHIPISAMDRQLSDAPYAEFIRLLEQREGLNRGIKSIEIPVSLYFPTNIGEGILAESRTISFSDYDPSYMIQRILRELSNGSRLYTNNIAIPSLVDLLSTKPEVTELNEGGNLVTLRFKSVLDDVVSVSKLKVNTLFAMLTYSITSFYPDVAGIKIYVGESLIQQLLPDGILSEEKLVSNALLTRRNLSQYLLKQLNIYFANIDNNRILPVIRNLLFKSRINVRTTLLELSKGPIEMDYIMQATMPSIPFTIDDAEIIGNALDGNTIVVNFSSSVYENLKSLSVEQEKIFVYSIVNTLCRWKQIKAVQFLFNGATVDYISGELYWNSEFYPNYKITY